MSLFNKKTITAAVLFAMAALAGPPELAAGKQILQSPGNTYKWGQGTRYQYNNRLYRSTCRGVVRSSNTYTAAWTQKFTSRTFTRQVSRNCNYTQSYRPGTAGAAIGRSGSGKIYGNSKRYSRHEQIIYYSQYQSSRGTRGATLGTR
ncbi:MAG: hypothetical protein U9P14_03960 [Gemmatimonadota bacterium]|nr:hypothetical protein [Gemmatimonadota bacterium]